MKLTFAKELYPKSALLKAAYNFTDRAYVHLGVEGDAYTVELTPKDAGGAVSEYEFVNEILCQSVRHTVYTQTKGLRELLAARALAACVIEGEPADESSEPEFEGDADAILKSWFEAHDPA